MLEAWPSLPMARERRKVLLEVGALQGLEPAQVQEPKNSKLKRRGRDDRPELGRFQPPREAF